MATSITLPGIGNSGDAHWQTHWERRDLGMVRVQPSSWDHPELDDWMASLDRVVAQSPAPPLLIVHSLACLLVAYWAAAGGGGGGGGGGVRGAFLVSVPDPTGPAFPRREAPSFREPPDLALPFPALIVASTNDPFGDLDHARRRAAAWGSGLVVAGALGHINEASQLGDWPQGAMLLEAFRAGTAQRA